MIDNTKAVTAFEEACNTLAEAVNRQLFNGSRDWYWVADDIGGVCDFDDAAYIAPEDMVRILKHGITYDEYEEWQDANLENEQFINLASWLKGLRHEQLKNKEEKK